MKIQCDVCDKDEASVFCVADEAALCSACDHRVHHANKLAGKHQRFSLHHPSPKQIPLCDICQERRAFLFCQQDRAILCIECDIQIHKANEHTQKHTRFLLTGVKLSSTCTLYASSPSSTESASPSLNNFSKSDSVSNIKSQELVKNPVFVPSKSTTPSIAKSTTVPATAVAAPVSFDKTNTQLTSGMNFNVGNSISEYLIDMLPGWHVEDFLDSSKIGDGMPFWGGDMENNMSGFPTEKMGFWVPQVSHQTQNQSLNISFGANNGFKEQAKEFTNNNNNNNMMKSSRIWNEENSFAVPQISPPSSSLKRSRNLW